MNDAGNDYKYDVALSFAGEQRSYVEEVKDYLESQGLKVFYDNDNEVDMWGKNLVDYFNSIFLEQAKHCVVFISKEYADKVWTNYERQVAQARQLVEQDYILPARFDDVELQGGIPTRHYFNLNNYTPEEFGKLIVEKVGQDRENQGVKPPEVTYRTPRVAKSFNSYEKREFWIRTIGQQLAERCDEASGPNLDLDCSTIDQGDKLSIRIIAFGDTIYSLDIHRGGPTSDEGLAFSYSESKPSYGAGYHAFGELIWSKEHDKVVMRLTDFSLFESTSSDSLWTLEEFIDKLWENIVNLIEERY